MQEEIIVEVTPSGRVSIEANNFQGSACSVATQQLEIVLGGRGAKKDTAYKPEFSMPASTSQQVKSTF